MCNDNFSQERCRKYPRAKFHNYNGGEYFVTFCTRNKKHYFGEIADGKMHLSRVGYFLQSNIESIQSHFDDVIIPLFVIMPNHVHAIISIVGSRPAATETIAANVGRLNQLARISVATDRNPAETTHHNSRLAVVVGSIKSAVKRFATENNIEFDWQSRYHDHIIRGPRDGNIITEYIEK